jgi:hypothetical protein
VDPDLIAAQYARLGATSAWLSRSFFAGLEPACIGPEVTALRRRLRYWARQSPEVWERKRLELARRLGN